MQRTISAWRLRRRLPGARGRPAAIRAGMSPGGRNAGSSGSTTRRTPGTRGRRGEQRGQVGAAARGCPGAQRLLQQPQAHDVAQVADGAVDADLVGEVGRPARLGQHRRVQLDPDQRPGAAGDVGEPVRRRRARRPRPRRCRASRPRSPAPAGSPVVVGTSGSSVPTASPGSAQRREAAAGSARAASISSRRPGAGARRRAARWWRRW